MGSRVQKVNGTTHVNEKVKQIWVVEARKLMVLPTEKLI